MYSLEISVEHGITFSLVSSFLTLHLRDSWK